MRGGANAAGRNHRDTGPADGGAQQFQIIALLRSVAVHGGEQDLARTQAIRAAPSSRAHPARSAPGRR